MDKRKGIILAIVLFLIIGLGTFVFAGSDEEPENGTIPSQQSGEGGNGSETNPSDTNEEINDGNLTGEGGTGNPSRDNVTTPVVDEVETPVTDDNNANTIDWASLLNELAQMVNTAKDRKDIEAAIEFRENNNITAENIESLGETALDSLKTVNAILDDETAPAIEPDLDGKFFKEVSISINDDTKYTFVLERLDGESIPEGTTLDNINLEGEYKLIVTDAAFNETVVMFTIDRNETDATKTTMDVANATHFDSIEDAVATITDLSLDKVVVENQNTKESVTFVAEDGKVEIKLTEEATFKLTAYDKAGNETTYWLAVDETDPTIFFADSDGNELSDLTNEDVTITVSDKFLTEVTVTDANGNKTVYKEFTTNGNNENKTFTLTLDEDGIYTVTAKDKVGRTNTGTIEIDKTAPVYSYLSFRVDGDATSGVETYYATKGDIIYVSIATSELLCDDFRFVITDSEGNEFRYKETKDVWTNDRKERVYQAYIELPEEFAEGKLTATVENVKDLAGNTSEKNLKSDKVVVDRIEPESFKIQIINNDNPSSSYIKNGETIRVRVTFTEALSVLPTLTIGNYSETFKNVGDGKGNDLFSADIEIPVDEITLAEGNLAYTISNFKDLAGNDGESITATSDLIYDRTPSKAGIANFYVSGVDGEVVKENGKDYVDYYATYGNKLVAYVRTTEQLSENPTFTLVYGDTKIVIPSEDVVEIPEEKDGYKYRYQATYVVSENFEKIEKEVKLEITNIVDLAGNITINENGEDVIGISNRNRVFIDTLAPQINELRFNSSNKIDNGYANNTHSVGVYLTVHEELASNPTFIIDGKSYAKNQGNVSTNGYMYAAVTKLPENTKEGKLSFSVTVSDKLGNTATYTQDDIKNNVDGYDGVIYDVTPPEINGLESNSTYIGSVSYKISDNSNRFTVYYGPATENYEDLTWQNYVGTDEEAIGYANGITFTDVVSNYNACVRDNAGNVSCVKNISLIKNDSTNVVTALENGGNIVLSDNLTITEQINITAGKELTLDLNGKTIELAGGKNFNVTGGTLTIEGSGTIKEVAPYYAPVMIHRDTDNIEINIGKDVTLEGWAGIFIDIDADPKDNPNAGKTIINFAGNINSVIDTTGAAGHGIYINGENKNTISYPIINIYEGANINSLGDGIYAAGYAEWNIYGGSIEAPGMAIGIKAGKLNIFGGTFKATGPNSMPTENFGNGINESGAALQIESNPDYAGAIDINISGGTFISENAAAIYEYDSTNSETRVNSFSISGGNFISNNYANNFSYNDAFLTKFPGFMTGGKFNKNTDDIEKYLASGYIIETQADGSYKIVQG